MKTALRSSTLSYMCEVHMVRVVGTEVDDSYYRRHLERYIYTHHLLTLNPVSFILPPHTVWGHA